MDNQLIAKITELVLEKISQASQSDTSYQGLTQEELQEWQTFHLMNQERDHTQRTAVTSSDKALSAQELENWDSLQQTFSKTSPSQTNDLITLKKFS
ncbi:hypothetical protein ACQKNC_06150 [Lysinibacillus sp. NPDC094177]|uniref:hypothetical protein n=1 Tax=Lysinibacillus sp. NPDC094177 TaxID=3390580 RepID=UPI003D091866